MLVGCTLHNIDELEQRLVHVWDGMDQTITDSAIDDWRGCFVLVCGQTVDTLNKCCDIYYDAYHSAV